MERWIRLTQVNVHLYIRKHVRVGVRSLVARRGGGVVSERSAACGGRRTKLTLGPYHNGQTATWTHVIPNWVRCRGSPIGRNQVACTEDTCL